MSQRFQSAAPLKPSPMAGPIQTSGPTLDYRTPVPGGDAVGRVLHELARAESLDLAGAAGKLGVGLPLCLLGPLFATAMVEAVAARWGPDLLPSFATVFLLATVVLVPLLLWLERRTGGNFFLDAVRGEPSPLSASSYGEFEMRRTGFLWTCYAEIALAGPRLVWEFIDWLRGRPEGDTSTRLVATQVANELFVAGEGLGMADLVRPDRPAAQVARAVKLLLVEEWVGLSSRRDRVWLSSRTAIRLAEVLAQPPHTHLPAVTHAPARPGDGMRLTRG